MDLDNRFLLIVDSSTNDILVRLSHYLIKNSSYLIDMLFEEDQTESDITIPIDIPVATMAHSEVLTDLLKLDLIKWNKNRIEEEHFSKEFERDLLYSSFPKTPFCLYGEEKYFCAEDIIGRIAGLDLFDIYVDLLPFFHKYYFRQQELFILNNFALFIFAAELYKKKLIRDPAEFQQEVKTPTDLQTELIRGSFKPFDFVISYNKYQDINTLVPTKNANIIKQLYSLVHDKAPSFWKNENWTVHNEQEGSMDIDDLQVRPPKEFSHSLEFWQDLKENRPSIIRYVSFTMKSWVFTMLNYPVHLLKFLKGVSLEGDFNYNMILKVRHYCPNLRVIKIINPSSVKKLFLPLDIVDFFPSLRSLSLENITLVRLPVSSSKENMKEVQKPIELHLKKCPMLFPEQTSLLRTPIRNLQIEIHSKRMMPNFQHLIYRDLKVIKCKLFLRPYQQKSVSINLAQFDTLDILEIVGETPDRWSVNVNFGSKPSTVANLDLQDLEGVVLEGKAQVNELRLGKLEFAALKGVSANKIFTRHAYFSRDTHPDFWGNLEFMNNFRNTKGVKLYPSQMNINPRARFAGRFEISTEELSGTSLHHILQKQNKGNAVSLLPKFRQNKNTVVLVLEFNKLIDVYASSKKAAEKVINLITK